MSSEIPKEEIVGSLNARATMTLVCAAVKKVILQNYVEESSLYVSLDDLKRGEEYLLVLRVNKDGTIRLGVQTKSEDMEGGVVRLIIEGCEGSSERL